MRKTSPRLPRGIDWLLRRLLPAALRDEMLAEIEDSFARSYRTLGRRPARWRLRGEAASLILLRFRGRLPLEVPDHRRSPVRKNRMDSLLQDLRFALRRLRTRGAHASLTIGLLTVGLGATVTLYSVLDAIFLQPVPYPEARRLVAMGTTFAPEHDRLASISWPNYADVAASATSFEAIGAALPLNLVAAGPEQRAVKLRAAAYSEGFLSLLRVEPELGRMLTASEHRGDDSPVALISYGAWQRHFGGRSRLTELEIRSTEGAYPVVGVLPRDFVAPEAAGVGNAEVWLPAALVLDQIADRGTRVLGIIGRLGPGVEIGTAQAEIDALSQRLASQYPADNAPGGDAFGIGVRDLTEETAGEFGDAYRILLGAVASLLLITVVNVAALQLAQLPGRASEIALRDALGAGRGRIMRQLLIESSLLATLGGLLAIAFASLSIGAFVRAYPGSLPRAAEIALDGRAVAFAIGLALVTGIGCGMLPALRSVSARVRPRISSARHGVTHRGRRFAGALVVAEIALALILFTSAALLVNSFARLRGVDPGFEVEGLMALRADPGSAGLDTVAARRYVTDVLGDLRALPEVAAAASTVNLPLERVNWRPGITFENGDATDTGVNARVTSDGYFDTIGVPLVAGRDFDAVDDPRAPQVMIVNEAFVRRYLSEGDALGRRLTFAHPFSDAGAVEHEVIGVVADMNDRLDAGPVPEIYLPLTQTGWPNAKIVYRSDRPGPAGTAVADVVEKISATVPIDWHRSLDEIVGAGVGQQRFLAQLVAVFATLAVLLANAGIYALVAHGLQARRHEIGVRMAVGARSGEVVRLLMRDSLRATGLGIVVGLAAASVTSRLLSSQLYGVGTVDGPTYAAVALSFAACATLAALLPALRATRIDAVRTLQED